MEERLKKYMHDYKCYGTCTKEIYEGDCCDHGKCEYQIKKEGNQCQVVQPSQPVPDSTSNKNNKPKRKPPQRLLCPLPPPKCLLRFRTHDLVKVKK